MIILISFGSASAEVFLSDDFEDGNLTEWYSVPKARIIDATSGKVNSGEYALLIPYDLPAECPEHMDCNRFIQKDFSGENLTHFFIRGYFYIQKPQTVEETVKARKLFYMFSENHSSKPYWHIMVSANDGKENVEYPQPLSLSIGSQFTPEYSDIAYPTWRLAKGELHYDRWHCLELEVKLNTPGESDGICRLWLDGNRIFNKTEISIRESNKALGRARIGAQIDRNGDCLERHENRYWDDIVISDTYNGPLKRDVSSLPLTSPGNLKITEN